MFTYFRKHWILHRARRNGFIPSKKWFNADQIKDKFDLSPISILLMLVLLWVVSAVLLSLAHEKLTDFANWREGRPALFSVWAKKNFSAVDYAETNRRLNAAKASVPLHVKVNVERSNRIRHDITSFFEAVVRRTEAEAHKAQFKEPDPQIEKAVLSLYRANEIAAALSEPVRRKAADDTIDQLLRHGISGSADQLPGFGKGNILVIHSGDKTYTRIPEDGETAAHIISDALKLDSESRNGFCAVVPRFWETGNLLYDSTATQKEQKTAEKKVEPEIRNYPAGTRLITEGELLTPDLRELLQTYRNTLTVKDGFTLFVCQLTVSFILLLAAMFLLYIIHRHFFTSARDFTLGVFIIIVALVANFSAFQLFFYLHSLGNFSNKMQLICMIPIALGPALLTVFCGSRVAIFGGILISGISVQMLPQFDIPRLFLHWIVISTLIALWLRETNNYRTFFLRLFLGSLALTALIDADYAIEIAQLNMIGESAICVSCTALACAMAGLMLVFFFELLFNADTRMSLMMLCDFNHPLLERLKREANGTMSHALNVSVLAEDAANAIRVNTLRAKAGALFHDIGKLKMPSYFIENNPESRHEYEKMSPLRSCALIRSHVREGLILAKQYRLNSFIRSAIRTHHGDDLVSFFYRKAVEENGADAPDPVIEEQFRYDGPPPCSKEETIISLADACEAACRSISDPTPKKIEEMVENVIVGRLRGRQLRLSMLTLKEIGVVKACFIKDLCDLVHRRISYAQEGKKDDTASLRVEVQKTSGSAEK